MKKVIIASHHNLAQGLKDTFNYIAPNVVEITAVSAYVTNTPIEDEIKAALQDISEQDEIIVFTDILGGSVNQAFTKYLTNGYLTNCQLTNKNIHIISGVNLPVIMSILLELNDVPIDENMIRTMINEAREQLVYVNDVVISQSMPDEEDE